MLLVSPVDLGLGLGFVCDGSIKANIGPDISLARGFLAEYRSNSLASKTRFEGFSSSFDEETSQPVH